MSNRLEVIARLRDEMSGGITGITRNLDRMASMAEASFARANRTANLVKTTIAAIAGSALVKGSLGEAAAVDRAQMQLEAVLGTQEKAQAALERLRAIPVTKFFGTDEMVQAFVRLQTIGVPAAEKTVADLRNIAVIFNSDLSTAVNAFVSGKAGALSRLGVDVQKVGDQVVLTSGNIRVQTDDTAKAMREGLLDLWEKRFPDVATKASSLFEQKMAVLRSVVMDVAGDVGGAFLPKLKELADQAIGFINQHRSQIAAVAQSTGEILSLTAEFMVTKLDQTLFSPDFWAKLPAVSSRAFGAMVSEYSLALGVMSANWDLWLPTLVLSGSVAFKSFAGSTVLIFERMLAKILEEFQKFTQGFAAGVLAPIGNLAGRLGKALEAAIPGQESRLTSGLSAEIDAMVDNADASLGLFEARLEAFRQKNGGQSLLDQGMSMIGGVADNTGVTALAASWQAAIERNAKAAEELRVKLAGVSTDAPSAMGKIEEGADAAEKKLGKVKTVAQEVADQVKAAFDAIETRMGPVIEKMDAMVALRKRQLQETLDSSGGGSSIDSGDQAVRDAERQLVQTRIDEARQKIGALQGQPGQESAAAALSLDVQRLTIDLAALDRQSREMSSPWAAFNAGLKEGLAGLQMTAAKWKSFASESVGSVASALKSGIVDNVMKAAQGMQKWGEAGKQILLGLAQSLGEVALQLAGVVLQQLALNAAQNTSGWVTTILKVLGGTVTSKANGGVMAGGFNAIPRAATGALFQGPQLAILGDNPSRMEAAVPLPNGREIPVQLKGGDGGGMQLIFNINALDPRGVREMLMSEQGTIARAVANAVESSPSTRRRIRGS